MPTSSNSISRMPAVLGKVGFSRSTLLNKIKVGTFPAPVKLSARINGWRDADVDTWLLDPMGWAATATMQSREAL